MTTRLLMIGIDGADGRLLDRCSADGSLPRLAALRVSGRARRLSAPQGLTDDATWASFQYAVEVGEHGRYHFCFPQRGGRLGKAHWAERDRLAFWDELSDQGLRVAIFDVPKCRNPRPLNGVHLVDWLVHGRYFPKPRSQPPALAADILARFGPAPPSQCGYGQTVLSDVDIRAITQNLRDGVAKKRAASLHYLGSEHWDLFVIGFKEAHCGNHAFWDFDASHPAYDPARHARVGDPVMSILRDIDNAIGDLVGAAGSTAEVVVFSPTDFEANGCLDHLMPEIVERLNANLSVIHAGPIEGPPGRWSSSQASPSHDWRCSILPYNENWAAIRVSRQIQTPGSDPSAGEPPDAVLLQTIETQLRSLRDVESGQPVVSAITRPSSELRGSRAKSLPDLLVHCASGLFPNGVMSASLGCIEAQCPPMRPGNHIAGGFIFADGAFVADAIANVRTVADIGSLTKAALAR